MLWKILGKVLPTANVITGASPLMVAAAFANDNAEKAVCFGYTQLFVFGCIMYVMLEMNRKSPTTGGY